jgi:hypothetical protein
MRTNTEILIEGKIDLQKTPGRKDAWVTKQVEYDFFLSLHITKIDGVDIATTKDAFLALSSRFPSIQFKGKLLTELFTNISLPQNAADILHITLGNFPDFRVGRNVANDVDAKKIEMAKALAGQELTLFLSTNDFELVATSKQVKDVTMDFGVAEYASTVGFKRDAILNLKPSDKTQKQLADYAKKVFGSDYQLWTSKQEPVAFHLTIAQTDKLSVALGDALVSKPQLGHPIFSSQDAKTSSQQSVQTDEMSSVITRNEI